MRPFLAVALILGLAACGGNDASPTTPASPKPAPTPAPTPSVNPFAAACGTPLPPFDKSYGFGIKVQLEPTPNRKILNANPIIKDAAYCTAAGIPGNTICNTRREDNPQREACDHYISGTSDEGRPGPNWFQQVDGKLLKCGGIGATPAEAPNCSLKPENQYLLDISAKGKYVACGGQGSPGTCGVCIIDRWNHDGDSPAGLCGLD